MKTSIHSTLPSKTGRHCNPIHTKFLALSLGISVAALSLLGSHSAMAGTDSMTNSDPGGTTSFNTAGKWANQLAPSAGNDYFTSSFEMRGIAPGTFAGDSLTISSGGALHGKMNGTLTFSNGTGLFLNGGTIYQANSFNSGAIFGIAGTITANAGTTSFLGASSGESLDISGAIGGSGSLTIAGTANSGGDVSFVTFDASNTISGTVSVVTPSGGIQNATNRLLQLNNVNALQNATLALTGGGGQTNVVSFTSAANTGAFNIGALSGAANQALTDTASTAVAISVGANNASTTYSGVLSGAGSLTKVGNGTLTLSGANSYSGNTTINGGTLKLLGSGTLAATSNVNINAGAIFDTTNSAFTMLGTKTFKFTLDPTGTGSAGLLNAASLDITAANVDFALGGIGSLDDTAYVIANYTSLTGAQFASVSDLPAGYAINYGYNGGTEIALMAVPEPATTGMVLMGGVVMLVLLRRRNRKA